MKKGLSKCFVSMLFAIAYPAVTQNQPPDPNQGGSGKPQAIISEVITGPATVQDINHQKRLITLKDAEGDTIRLKFNEPAPDIEHLRKGAQVSVNYYKSVAVMLSKP